MKFGFTLVAGIRDAAGRDVIAMGEGPKTLTGSNESGQDHPPQ